MIRDSHQPFEPDRNSFGEVNQLLAAIDEAVNLIREIDEDDIRDESIAKASIWDGLHYFVEDSLTDLGTEVPLDFTEEQLLLMNEVLARAVEEQLPCFLFEQICHLYPDSSQLSELYLTAMNAGNLYVAIKLHDLEVPLPARLAAQRFEGIPSLSTSQSLGFSEVIDYLGQNFPQLGNELRLECQSVVIETESFYTGLLYCGAVEELYKIVQHNPGGGLAFSELASRVSHKSIRSLLLQVDYSMEDLRESRIRAMTGISSFQGNAKELKEEFNSRVSSNHSFFEPDLLVMYDRDEIYNEVKGDQLYALQFALTSPYGLLYEGMHESTSEEVHTFGKLGRLTYSFKLWRFDARRYLDPDTGEVSSLFEKFGLERGGSEEEHYSRGANEYWGPRFSAHIDRNFESLIPQQWRDHGLDSEEIERGFTFEIRQGFLLIADEELGTLVIRNSGKEFGRDKLPHPVMYSETPYLAGNSRYSPENLGMEDVKANFSPFLKCSTFRHVFRETSKLPQLVDRALLMREAIGSWKFETDPRRSFIVDPDTGAEGFVGGYNSVGFHDLVQMLRALSFEGEHYVDLALVHRDRIPQSLLPFSDDHARTTDGFGDEPSSFQTKLRVTPEVTSLLACAIKGPSSDELRQLNRSGITDFIQAGIDHHAELLILPRNEL